MTQELLFEVEGPVARITLNRPDSLNALSANLRQALGDAFDRFENDDGLKVAILSGAGDRAFCAGMDLKEAAGSALRIPPRDFLPVLGDNKLVTKPVIAAVNGVAYAGGWLLAQMCDLCIASDNARFAITEAKVGRGMPWAAPLVHMLPQRIVMELLLTGEPLSAKRAYELGYVNAVVPPADLQAAAMRMALSIAANAPLTVKAARELVYLSTEMGRSAALRAGRDLFEPVYLSDDALEGPKAFAEKRAPKWSGR